MFGFAVFVFGFFHGLLFSLVPFEKRKLALYRFGVVFALHDKKLLESSGIFQYIKDLVYFTISGATAYFIAVQPAQDASECRDPALVIFAPDVFGH